MHCVCAISNTHKHTFTPLSFCLSHNTLLPIRPHDLPCGPTVDVSRVETSVVTATRSRGRAGSSPTSPGRHSSTSGGGGEGYTLDGGRRFAASGGLTQQTRSSIVHGSPVHCSVCDTRRDASVTSCSTEPLGSSAERQAERILVPVTRGLLTTVNQKNVKVLMQVFSFCHTVRGHEAHRINTFPTAGKTNKKTNKM